MAQDERVVSAVVPADVSQSGQIACRWCGLFSEPGPACDLCGSPLVDAPPLDVPQLVYVPAGGPVDLPPPESPPAEPPSAAAFVPPQMVASPAAAPLLAEPEPDLEDLTLTEPVAEFIAQTATIAEPAASPVTETPRVSEDLVAAEDFVAAEDLVATEDLVASDSVVVADELSLSDDPVAAETPAAADELFAADAAAPIEDLVPTEEIAAPEDPQIGEPQEAEEDPVETAAPLTETTPGAESPRRLSRFFRPHERPAEPPPGVEFESPGDAEANLESSSDQEQVSADPEPVPEADQAPDAVADVEARRILSGRLWPKKEPRPQVEPEIEAESEIEVVATPTIVEVQPIPESAVPEEEDDPAPVADAGPDDGSRTSKRGRSWWKRGRKASTEDDIPADEAGTEPQGDASLAPSAAAETPAEIEDDFGPTVELAAPAVEVHVEPDVQIQPDRQIQADAQMQPEISEPEIEEAVEEVAVEAASAGVAVEPEPVAPPAPAPSPEPQPEPSTPRVVDHPTAPSAPLETPLSEPPPWLEAKAPLSDDPMTVREAAIREMLSIGAEWSSQPAGSGAKPAPAAEGEPRGSKLPWKRRKRGKSEGFAAPSVSKGGSGTIAFETTAALIAGGKVSYDIPAVPTTRRGVLDSPDGEYLVVCSRCGQPSKGGLCDACEDALGQLRRLTAGALEDE